MDGNKDEALRCLQLAKRAVDLRDFSKALRMAEKAQRMFPTVEGAAYVRLCTAHLNQTAAAGAARAAAAGAAAAGAAAAGAAAAGAAAGGTGGAAGGAKPGSTAAAAGGGVREGAGAVHAETPFFPRGENSNACCNSRESGSFRSGTTTRTERAAAAAARAAAAAATPSPCEESGFPRGSVSCSSSRSTDSNSSRSSPLFSSSAQPQTQQSNSSMTCGTPAASSSSPAAAAAAAKTNWKNSSKRGGGSGGNRHRQGNEKQQQQTAAAKSNDCVRRPAAAAAAENRDDSNSAASTGAAPTAPSANTPQSQTADAAAAAANARAFFAEEDRQQQQQQRSQQQQQRSQQQQQRSQQQQQRPQQQQQQRAQQQQQQRSQQQQQRSQQQQQGSQQQQQQRSQQQQQRSQQQQQGQAGGNKGPAATAAASTAASSATHASSTGTARATSNNKWTNAPTFSSTECTYTAEQVALCTKVLTTRCYYQTLGLERGASEDAIKRAYKKLALLLHPDKNRAPHAEEAFKKVSKVSQCLLDVDKRKRYDQEGEEVTTENPRVRYRQQQQQQQQQDGISPEEFFQAFFGFPVGAADFHARHAQFAARRQTPRGSPHPDHSGGAYYLLQVLPMALMFLIMFLGNFFTSPPSQPVVPYSFVPGGEFPLQRLTRYHSIRFYVSPYFKRDYPDDSEKLRELEMNIELKYYHDKCQKEKEDLSRQLSAAHYYRAPEAEVRAILDRPRPHCEVYDILWSERTRRRG